MSNKLPALYIIRHGRTLWNAEGRLQGQRDIALDDVGRAQARGNGRLLSDLLGSAQGFEFISSPLIRARETMEIIRRDMKLPASDYACEPQIKEISFGDWEGRTRKALQSEYPELMALRDADGWNFTPPNGESYAAMSRRVEAFLTGLSRDAVVVTHGGVLRILQVLIGDAPRSGAPKLSAPQDRIMRICNGSIDWLPA